ncbi:MAG: hypothetical protein FWF49_03150, partial [Oscillospiraceae bacterium]|nr:hypothetical protein [Oscillospiraceae bacterium]
GGYQQELLWVRQDWLDALNLPQPKTIDDIETTALAFMNNNTQLGGADYPIGINVNGIHAFDGYRNSYGLDPVANAMGAYPMTWIKNAAGQIVYGSIQPEFKQVLAKVRDWVVNGIVDINSFTQSWSDIWANPALKRTGMWFFPLTWSGTSAQTSFLKRNPGAELSMYAAPLNVNGDGKSNYRGPDPMEGMLCVRKGYGNPEVVLRAFDLYNRMTTDTTYEGYQALQPWRDMGSLNTSWYYLAPLSTFAIRDDRIAVTVGEQVVNYIDNGVLPPAGAESNLYLQEVKNWVDGSNNANDWVTWMFRYCASVKEDDPVFNKMQPAFYGQTPTMVTSWSDLLASEYQMINDILTGVQDINYFDQWVSDWKAAGGDAITNEIANGQY